MFVPNFKSPGAVVPEKSLKKNKKKLKHTNIVMEMMKTIYPLYTLYAGGV